MIVTIDGASATGKSTISKAVAERLNLLLFDTGAMYRCFAYYKKLNPDLSLKDAVDSFRLDTIDMGFHAHYFLSGEDVTFLIRTPEISELASKYSKEPLVRELMQEQQREYGIQGNAVFEGRDMGSVVFPNANFKFFLKADIEERARRRFAELESNSQLGGLTLEDIKRQTAERDRRDEERAHSPLVIPEGAKIIDTSQLSIDQIVDLICKDVEGALDEGSV